METGKMSSGSIPSSDLNILRVSLSATDVNRLAQLFYERSGIRLPAMTDKPKVVAGLRAVFEEVGIHIED